LDPVLDETLYGPDEFLRVLSDIDWQELGFAKLLGFCNFGKEVGLELQEVMGVEVRES
jgi:hypothetical protein